MSSLHQDVTSACSACLSFTCLRARLTIAHCSHTRCFQRSQCKAINARPRQCITGCTESFRAQKDQTSAQLTPKVLLRQSFSRHLKAESLAFCLVISYLKLPDCSAGLTQLTIFMLGDFVRFAGCDSFFEVVKLEKSLALIVNAF